MKRFSKLTILLLVVVTACAPRKSASQPVPEISTTLPEVPVTPDPGGNNMPPADQSSSAAAITFEDNGKTFHYNVGDSFLLNLGTDVFEWTVTVENQNVVALRVGVMVIKGAQGLFDALGPGTTTLTAVGDPLCRKSSPPCGAPTILYKVTLIVE